MKKKKILVRSVLVLVALAALCACAWCVWYIVQYYQGQAFGDRMRTNISDDGGSFQLERVKIPVDFDELQGMNPDIYAWIRIPDTDISYAVLQLLCARRRSLVSRGIYQGDAGKIDVGGRRRLGHGVRAYHAVARWRTRCKRGQRTEHRAYHKTFYNRVFHFRCSLFRIRPGLRSMPQQDRM